MTSTPDAEARARALSTGKVPRYVGNYSVDKTIGEGSFGKVKLGTHVPTQQKVAIKVLEKAKIQEGADSERVQREIQVLRLLSHPNIVRLYEVIDTPTEIHLILEYSGGGELFDYIVAHGKVKEKEARKFFRQIVSAVEYCHSNSVIHRDLKPENLLLDSDRNIKIIDFGFSNIITPGTCLNTFCGSPAYAAPEMIAGKEYAGPEVDIWSMGVILYALLCGYLPFDDANISKLYEKIVRGKYECPPSMTPASKSLIDRMLVIDPAKRITLGDIARDDWLNEGCEPLVFADHNNSTVDSLDESIVGEMESLGYEFQDVATAVERNMQNNMTATYHLLCDKKRKDPTATLLPGAPLPSIPRSGSASSSSPRRASNTKPRVSSPLAINSSVRDSPTRTESMSGSAPTNSPAPLSAIPVDRTQTAAPAPSPVLPEKKGILAAIRGESRARRHSVSGPTANGEAPPLDITPIDTGAAERAAIMPAKKSPTSPNTKRSTLNSPPSPMSASPPAVSAAATAVPPGPASPKSAVGSVVAQAQRPRKFSLDTAAAALAAAFGSKKEEDKNSQLRTVKGVFSVSTTSSKSPDEIMAEVQRVLLASNIEWTQSAYCLQCNDTSTPDAVRFEIEVVKIPNMVLFGLRLKRVQGDTWAYKRLCHSLVSMMKL